MWYNFYMPVPAAEKTLEGYEGKRIYQIDPAARKRLESRAHISEESWTVYVFMFFEFFGTIYQVI